MNESSGEIVAVQVPKWWLDDVLEVLRDLGVHQPLVIEAEGFSTVHNVSHSGSHVRSEPTESNRTSGDHFGSQGGSDAAT